MDAVQIDPSLDRVLRDHQREGVVFLHRCLMGKQPAQQKCRRHGAILADDMGLGKSLQALTVMWTLKPFLGKAVLCCPATLVENWSHEVNKWLGSRCPCKVVNSSAKSSIKQSASDPELALLIVSFESLRAHAPLLADAGVGLIICDEAHRLKNDKALVNQTIASLHCRRLLLTGTPIQNSLTDLFVLCDLSNPGILGTWEAFNRLYLTPVMGGREPGAGDKQVRFGEARFAALIKIVSQVVIARSNTLNAKRLPPNDIFNVFVSLTPEQKQRYNASIETLGSASVGGPSNRLAAARCVVQNLRTVIDTPALTKWEQNDVLGITKPCVLHEGQFDNLDPQKSTAEFVNGKGKSVYQFFRNREAVTSLLGWVWHRGGGGGDGPRRGAGG